MQHWDDLQYLLALDEHGTLANAAKALKTNPTTVSRHIKRLSETYQKTLVMRQPNGEWQLTKEGAVFSATARRCFEEIDALSADTPTVRPCITVTTTEFIGENVLAPHLSNVLSAPSDIALTLDLRDRNVSLAYGEADLAVRLGRPTSGKLVASKIADIEMGIYAPEGRDAKRWVGLPSKYDWVPEMQMGFSHFKNEPLIRLGSFSSIRRVALEHGLACVGPVMMLDGWRGLRALPSSHMSHREVWSVYHETRRHDAALLQVRGWVKGCFSTQTERAVA